MNITVFGDLMVDVTVRIDRPVAVAGDTPAQITTGHGGSAANVSAWLAWQGVPTTFVGCVGNDAFGREGETVLQASGVRTALAVDGSLATGTCVILVGADGERTMFPDAGANAALRVEHLPADAFAPGGHLHITGYSLLSPSVRPTALAALEMARANAMSVSVDAASAAPLADMGGATFLALMGHTDVLFVTPDEGEVLGGERDPSAIGRALTPYAHLVIVKRGKDGATAFGDGLEVAAASALPPAPIVDTTGAGDAFAAGWIAAQHTGALVADSLTAACRLGALAATKIGARPEGPPRATTHVLG